MRLIDADMAIKSECGHSCGTDFDGCGFSEPCRTVRRILNVPTVQAVPIEVLQNALEKLSKMDGSLYDDVISRQVVMRIIEDLIKEYTE